MRLILLNSTTNFVDSFIFSFRAGSLLTRIFLIAEPLKQTKASERVAQIAGEMLAAGG